MSIKVLYWNEEASGGQFVFEPCSVIGRVCWVSLILTSCVCGGGWVWETCQSSREPHLWFKPVTCLLQGDWRIERGCDIDIHVHMYVSKCSMFVYMDIFLENDIQMVCVCVYSSA